LSEAPDEAIDLANLDDAVFERLYRERIEPCFQANEDARLQAVATFRQRLMIGAALTLAAMAAMLLFASNARLAFIVALFGAVITYIVAYQPLAAFGRKLKQDYCAAMGAAIGARFQVGAFEPPALTRFKALRLLPICDRSTFEDWFSGAHKRARYDLYEGELKRRRTDSKGRTRYTTIFRGQLIRMQFARNFLGVTIVRRDAGVFNVFGCGELEGRRLERVRLVDSSFEKAFEVWGTDQVEARYLLHPVMMERLFALETSFKGKNLRCAFEDGEMLIAIEGGNLFEPGDLFKPLVDPRRARRIVDEIAAMVRVMDQALSAQTMRVQN